MDMMIKCFFATTFVAALSMTAHPYTNCYYLSDAEGGSGTWADESRWKDGVKPVAGKENSVVRISGASVRIEDADWDTFKDVWEILLSNGATLTIATTTDGTFNGSIQGNGSRLVKVNANTVTAAAAWEGTAINMKGCDCIISNGCLKTALPSKSALSVFKVYKPGVLELTPGSHAYIGGLVGDGTVSNSFSSTVAQIVFVGELLDKYPSSYVKTPAPWHFTGDFVGHAPITAGEDITSGDWPGKYGPGEQYFDNVTATNLTKSTPRCFKGLLRVKALGTTATNGNSPVPSSFGNYDAIYFSGIAADAETGIQYTGDGGMSVPRKFDFYWNTLGSIAVVDAGATGGLTFTGQWTNKQAAKRHGTVSRLVLDGSNSQECVLSNTISNPSETNGIAFIKRGTGTWRFASAERTIHGPLFVEKGRLAFDSLAERGTACSIGDATVLYTNWYGAAECDEVPFAVMAGDGTTAVDAQTATFAYTGSSTAGCTNRPVAIRGAGRISTGASAKGIRLCGVFAAEEGVNTLVLSGTSANNCLSDVTNGVGLLKVVKEDSGTWRLAGNVDLGGGVDVRAGTLRISNRFSWYRLNLRETLDKGTHASAPAAPYGSNLLGFRTFAMWDADGNLLTTNLVETAVGGAAFKFAEGETGGAVTNGWSYNNSSQSWTAALSYTNVADNPLNPKSSGLLRMKMSATTSTEKFPQEALPETWMRFALHLPETLPPADCYDIFSEESTSGKSRSIEMKSFSMDASADGFTWHNVHEKGDNADGYNLGSAVWYSTKSRTRTASDGFKLSAKRDVTRVISDIPQVAVASGAVLDVEPEAGVTVSGIAYDKSLGGGTVKGVAFAPSGTLAVVGDVDTSVQNDLPMTFENCENVSNIGSWSVSVNGMLKRKARVKASDTSLTLCPAGISVIFR